jgi:hypothetical protein
LQHRANLHFAGKSPFLAIIGKFSSVLQLRFVCMFSAVSIQMVESLYDEITVILSHVAFVMSNYVPNTTTLK